MTMENPLQAAGTPRPAERIRARLETSRRELLDLTYQNRLLNFRELTGSGVRVVEERSDHVLELLYTKGKAMQFDASPLAPDTAGPDHDSLLEDYLAQHRNEQAPAYNSPESLAERQSDARLQTPYTEEVLERRLLNTFYKARESIEEQGVNTLFLALGSLYYTDEAKPGATLRAPVILLPVVMSRTNVRAAFKMSYNGDELCRNVSLEAKLKELGVDGWPDLVEADDQDELTPGTYFDSVSRCIAARPDWRLERNEIALGFFSFQKFVMYKDLDPKAWPAEATLEDHAVVSRLIGDIGFAAEPVVLPRDCRLDDVLNPAALFHVVDADSSQAEVLAEVATGRNMVIEGPPGTGKSQTITNLIAQSVAAGKTVLFVAEKLAALEVVKRRLTSIGLGDLVLEFHSNKTSKAAFLADLKQVWEQGAPRVEGFDANLKRLTESVGTLNRHADDVNQPIGQTGFSPYRLFGLLPRLQRLLADRQPPELEIPGWVEWTEARYEAVLEWTRELEVLVREVGAVDEHPFRDSRLVVALPGSLPGIAAAAERAQTAHRQLLAAWQPLADELQVPADLSLREVRTLLALLAEMTAWPDLATLPVDNPAWLIQADDIAAALDCAANVARLTAQWRPHLAEAAWDHPDAEALRACLAAYLPVWYRWLSGTYRAASRQLKPLWRIAPPGKLRDRVAGLQAIADVQQARSVLREKDGLMGQLFGSQWRAELSQADRLRQIGAAIRHLHATVRRPELRAPLCAALGRGFSSSAFRAVWEPAQQALDRYEAELRNVLQQLDVRVAERDEERDFLAQSLAVQGARLERWMTDIHRLPPMARFNAMRQHLQGEDLSGLAAVAGAWTGSATHLGELLTWRWGAAILQACLQTHPQLARFSGGLADRWVSNFRDADLKLFAHNRARVLKLHHANLPDRQGAGEMAILNKEFNKRARLMPIRRLMAEAGRAIQHAKPVFMMSPFSVATYLPRGSMLFDLVVFDEASQVKPVDALGAVARGRQTVVVGDSRQLPPTAFFEKLMDETADDESETKDVESILGQFNARGAHRNMLRWHYRSRHNSLIDYSNHAFYRDQLVVFPSPDAARTRLGLHFIHLPDCIYERGAHRARNPMEAQRVAEEVMRHAVEHPAETLGVVAFNINQMQEIADRVEILRRQRPECETFFGNHAAEPFFVKNLESVQGDERDVIFISVGFGRDAEGRLHMAFGALNGEGGERRLNVLITRAKQRCLVFSSIASDQIVVGPAAKAGVRHLKDFLRFAEQGACDGAERTTNEPEAPFELEVARAITALGYQVQHRVGSAGCSIDLAVAAPESPGRYLLGVECDGARYHASRWARDRDRLRQSVLEGLGWRIHGVWSRSWFDDHQGETSRLAAAIRQSAHPDAAAAKPLPQPPAEIQREQKASADAGPRAVPYACATLQPLPGDQGFEGLAENRIADLLMAVVAVESPIHVDEALRRVTEAAAVKRVTQRIRETFQGAVALLTRTRKVTLEEQILWAAGKPLDVVRNRAGVAGVSSSIEQVPYAEIALAFETILKSAFRISEDEICRETLDLLGLGLLSPQRRAHLVQTLQRSVAEGRLKRQGEFLVRGDSGPAL